MPDALQIVVREVALNIAYEKVNVIIFLKAIQKQESNASKYVFFDNFSFATVLEKYTETHDCEIYNSKNIGNY